MSNKSYAKSTELTKKLHELFPAGHSNFNTEMDYGGLDLFIDHAKGSHVWDVDGNEYIEYNGCMGPILNGHANPEFVKEIKEFLDNQGTNYGTSLLYTPNDIELAEMLIKYIPCAEEVKFCTTGTDAVETAIRLARAYTGKNKIVHFSDSYHGGFDTAMWNQYNWDWDRQTPPISADLPEFNEMYSRGLSPWAREDSYVIPWNDIETLEYVFEKYHDDIAMIHFEAMISDIMNLYPAPGFLEKIRELCDKYNVVMSIDEVITGFRYGLGGAQAYFGVTPDIATFGKAIGGGIPFSAVVGKKKIMDTFRDHCVSVGTFHGYALGVKAALTALKMYERNDGEIYRNIAQVQERLVTGMLSIAEKYNVDMAITEAPTMFYTLFGLKRARIDKFMDLEMLNDMDVDFYSAFRKNLMKEGIVLTICCRWFISGAHTMEDAEKTLIAFEKALVKTLEDKK